MPNVQGYANILAEMDKSVDALEKGTNAHRVAAIMRDVTKTIYKNILVEGLQPQEAVVIATVGLAAGFCGVFAPATVEGKEADVAEFAAEEFRRVLEHNFNEFAKQRDALEL